MSTEITSMAMLPNDSHPGPGCSCLECIRSYPDASVSTATRRPLVRLVHRSYGYDLVMNESVIELHGGKGLEASGAARDISGAEETEFDQNALALATAFDVLDECAKLLTVLLPSNHPHYRVLRDANNILERVRP